MTPLLSCGAGAPPFAPPGRGSIENFTSTSSSALASSRASLMSGGWMLFCGATWYIALASAPRSAGPVGPLADDGLADEDLDVLGQAGSMSRGRFIAGPMCCPVTIS